MAGKAVLEALRHVWQTLDSLNVPVAVAGGLAMAAWKYVRATQDVDLLVAVDRGDGDRLLRRLAEAGIQPKNDPPLTPLGRLDVVPMLWEPPETFLEVQIDLLIATSEYYRQALHRRVPTRLFELDVEIAVLTCEDLILQKLLAGRIIDRADVASLLRANRESLDLGYLRPWVKDLEVTAGLNEAWDEAFPGEPLPGGPRP